MWDVFRGAIILGQVINVGSVECSNLRLVTLLLGTISYLRDDPLVLFPSVVIYLNVGHSKVVGLLFTFLQEKLLDSPLIWDTVKERHISCVCVMCLFRIHEGGANEGSY